ncbi:hypothetical protein F4777DRAFT_597993 [Nemania sp. FL0916]|nr:hypothetical protein F4777DRAFT_597993 [Nemania sp. FL0916]
MAADRTRKFSPTIDVLGPSDFDTDAQIPRVIESILPRPLEGSQKIQCAATDCTGSGSGHKPDMLNQSPRSSDGPYISRPIAEDPLNFQDGFQYMKAPPPQMFSMRPNAPRKGVDLQKNSKNVDAVQEGNLTLNIVEGSSRAQGATSAAGPRNGDAAFTTSATMIRDTVPISDDYPTDSTISRHSKPEKTIHESTETTSSLQGPPFQNTSSFGKLVQSPKLQTRSSANTNRERRKLPKVFSNIQRKALIQSNLTNQTGSPAHHSESQVDASSPSKLHGSGPRRTSAATQTKQHQAILANYATKNRSLGTPKTQSSDTSDRPRPRRHGAVRLTRPLADDAHEDYRTLERPVSQTSNISKPRAPPARDRARTSKEQMSPTLAESNALRHKLGQSWNQFFVHEARRNELWEKKLEQMMEQLAERDNKAAGYLAKIQEQEQELTELNTVNDQQRALNEKQKASLIESDEQREKLKSKLKDYKDRLNDVTKEQQNIFKYFQPRYLQMREQLRQAELSHQAALENAVSATDAVRENIRKSVHEAKTVSQQEIEKLHLESATLQVKLAEREKNIAQEKDHVNDLRRELEASHDMNNNALKSLAMQNEEIIRKCTEGTAQIESIEQCVNKKDNGAQSLSEFLQRQESAPDLSNLVDGLKVHQTEILGSILSEFREQAVSGRELSSKATERLEAELSAVHESCTNIGERFQDMQIASNWHEKFVMVQTDYRALLQETARLKEETASMRDTAKTQLEERKALQQELAELKAGGRATDELFNRIEELEKEKHEIQESSNGKEMSISSLECELKQAKASLSAQNRQLEEKKHQLHSERENYRLATAKHHKEQELAIQQARNEQSTTARAEYRAIEKRLQEAEHNCTQLQEDLMHIKDESKKALKSQEDEASRQMHTILIPAVNRLDKVLEGLHTLEQSKSDLKTKLESWSKNHIDVSLLQQTVEKLGREHQDTIEDSKLLRELLDVQQKLGSTWQSHKSEVDALQRATDLEKSVKAESERTDCHEEDCRRSLEISQIVNRRVTIQSPGVAACGEEDIVPVSIEEERVTRRRAASLTGIMKPATLQVEGQQESQSYKNPLITTKPSRRPSRRRSTSRDGDSTPVAHSAYNRPVLGAAPRVVELVGEQGSNTTEAASNEKPVIPQKRRAETESNQTTDADKGQRAEEGLANIHSMSNYFRKPVPTATAMQPHAQPKRQRGGPIDRRQRSFVTYGPAALSTDVTHSVESNLAPLPSGLEAHR